MGDLENVNCTFLPDTSDLTNSISLHGTTGQGVFCTLCILVTYVTPKAGSEGLRDRGYVTECNSGNFIFCKHTL